VAKEPWYQEGLRFECTGCGDCCSGEPGHVWVDREEIARIAAHLGMGVEQFERRFVRSVGRRKSLVEYPDGDCIFLEPETRRCSVYAVRPVQCRTWPFWTSNLRSPKSWEATCQACPGSGTGTLYSIAEIEQRRRQRPM
jgi:uncharacterized protein